MHGITQTTKPINFSWPNVELYGITLIAKHTVPAFRIRRCSWQIAFPRVIVSASASSIVEAFFFFSKVFVSITIKIAYMGMLR